VADFNRWVDLKTELNTKYPDFIESDFTLNNDAWLVFENSADKKQLNAALSWSKKAITIRQESGNWLDTYANLLYKLGRKKEAIEHQEKALQLEPENDNIKINLAKMKKSEKTW
jgi:tetratricopeptide (TPR) repeat protein